MLTAIEAVCETHVFELLVVEVLERVIAVGILDLSVNGVEICLALLILLASKTVKFLLNSLGDESVEVLLGLVGRLVRIAIPSLVLLVGFLLVRFPSRWALRTLHSSEVCVVFLPW